MKNQSGLSLIATILALLIFSLFLAVAVSLVTTGSNIGLQEEQGVQAFYIAEGGVEWGLRKLNEGTKCDDLDTASAPPISLGRGTFALNDAGTREYRPTPQARLLNNILAGDISIQADRNLVTAGYAPSGRITIQTPPNPAEAIDYTSITTTTNPNDTFSGCTRGVGGTTAAAHNANDRIIQNQCDIISIGAITSNPLVSISRRVKTSVQQ